MPHSLSPVTRNPQIQADFYTQLIISELAQIIAHTNVRLTAIYAEAIALQVPLTDTKKRLLNLLNKRFSSHYIVLDASQVVLNDN